jgi:hypothetical protein
MMLPQGLIQKQMHSFPINDLDFANLYGGGAGADTAPSIYYDLVGYIRWESIEMGYKIDHYTTYAKVAPDQWVYFNSEARAPIQLKTKEKMACGRGCERGFDGRVYDMDAKLLVYAKRL